MENDFNLDLNEINRDVQQAEVLAMPLPMLGRTLLVDFRSASDDPPLVRVVAMARGPEERMRYLRRARPSLPRPKGLTVIPWPKLVESLERLGVLDQILERLAETGHPHAVTQCGIAIQELLRHQRAELVAAIRGDNFHTVWARRKS